MDYVSDVFLGYLTATSVWNDGPGLETFGPFAIEQSWNLSWTIFSHSLWPWISRSTSFSTNLGSDWNCSLQFIRNPEWTPTVDRPLFQWSYRYGDIQSGWGSLRWQFNRLDNNPKSIWSSDRTTGLPQLATNSMLLQDLLNQLSVCHWSIGWWRWNSACLWASPSSLIEFHYSRIRT